MKVIVERDIVLLDGTVKILKTSTKIKFDVDPKDFIDADIKQRWFDLKTPCDNVKFEEFLERSKIADVNHLESYRIYSEDYGGDYVFVFYNKKMPCEFINNETKMPLRKCCYWHKKSNEGTEILVDPKGNIV